MTDKVFNLLDAVNRSGIDNGYWGVIRDCDDTKTEFGTTKVYRLAGKWLYVYTENDGVNHVSDWSPSVKPDMVSRLDEEFEKKSRIYFYKLED